MGTHSLTHIYETAKAQTPFVTIYRQFDGYPEGIGMDIKEALGARKLVNGFNDPARQCNGIQCAAAMLVSALKKDRCGNVYLYAPGYGDEHFVYRLYPPGEGFRLRIEAGEEVIYDGSLTDFDAGKLQTA